MENGILAEDVGEGGGTAAGWCLVLLSTQFLLPEKRDFGSEMVFISKNNQDR